MEQNKLLNKPFKQTFHITDIKHNIIGIPFINKYIPTINILDSKINIKDKYLRMHNTTLTFFHRMNKQPPIFSKFYPIYNKERKHLKPLSGYFYEFPIKQVHQYEKNQNIQHIYMSALEFRPIRKFFRVTISFTISHYTEEQQKFFTMFNSQITQNEFEKLADLLLRYPTVYATSKFDVGKINSPLHLPLKPDAVFKKQRAREVPIHLHDKVNRLLDVLEQYDIISPVNKEEQPKGNTFINPVIILAKGESLKIVLDARYLNSLIDESKCNGPIEPIQVFLTKINGKYFTTADMSSAYNQMPLDKQSRRLTQFGIGYQQYKFNRLFYVISIEPAAFSAFMSKICRPLKLKKNAITYLDDVFMQSQTKDEMFTVLEKYHQILQNKKMKAAQTNHIFSQHA